MRVSCLRILALATFASANDVLQLELINKHVLQNFDETGDAVFLMDINKYKHFALTAPKGYHLFVLYAAGPQFCAICKPFNDAFQRVALSYHMVGKSETGQEHKPVYFAYVDFGATQDIPRMHGMTTLPHIVHLEAGKYEITAAAQGTLKLPEREFPIMKLDVTARDVLEWINKETGYRDVNIFMSQQEKVFRWALMLVGALAVIALGIKILFICRRRPGVIAVVGLLIHYIATSGIFYNLLQGMQWVGRDQQGNIQFLMTSARGQFLAEGLTMSGLTLLSGLSFLAASRLPFTEMGRKMSAANIAYSMVALIVTSTAAMYVVIFAYIQKAGWYSGTDFAPPDHFRRGPLRVDQGNTF